MRTVYVVLFYFVVFMIFFCVIEDIGPTSLSELLVLSFRPVLSFFNYINWCIFISIKELYFVVFVLVFCLRFNPLFRHSISRLFLNHKDYIFLYYLFLGYLSTCFQYLSVEWFFLSELLLRLVYFFYKLKWVSSTIFNFNMTLWYKVGRLTVFKSSNCYMRQLLQTLLLVRVCCGCPYVLLYWEYLSRNCYRLFWRMYKRKIRLLG